MLGKQRQGAAFAVLAFAAFSAAGWVGVSPDARAEVTDGTLTVLVNRDEDGDSTYSPADPPQPGIEIAVTDVAGASVRGITDDHGRFVLTGTDQLTGGQYLLSAAIPPNLSELAPVTPGKTFASFSSAVDLRKGDQTVRLGVAPVAVARAASPAPDRSLALRPADGSRPVRFAVGDKVWEDRDRSGRQDPGEPPVGGISVQLLTADGDVLESTVSSATGRFAFDDLPAGTYAVRFAGVPRGSRLTPAGAGDDRTADSDPDYTGATPPFSLGVGEPHVREATAADAVRAAYIHADLDAGITPQRYAIGNRVWLDVNADGAAQPDEPPATARVSLLQEDRVVASTTTDDQGSYRFTGLESGQYRVRFEPGKHRRFTVRNATSDPVQDSDADPATGTTPVIAVGPGAPDLVPAADLGVTDADLVNATVSAGLVGAYAVGDTVWRDDNGNGVLDAGEEGLPGISVELLDDGQRVLDRVVTGGNGRFAFTDLAAGAYRVRVLQPAGDLVFTSQRTGTNNAADSDTDPGGLTAPVVLGDGNPADTTVDAGLTSPVNLSAAPTPEATPAPVDTTLSATGGVPVSIPIAGLALLVSGLSCLLAARRSPLP